MSGAGRQQRNWLMTTENETVLRGSSTVSADIEGEGLGPQSAGGPAEQPAFIVPRNSFIRGLPFETYRMAPGINKSGLDIFRRSPFHFQHSKTNPKPPTPAQAFGQFFHSLVLEPDSVKDQYLIEQKFDRRTKDGKEAAAQFELASFGKTVVTALEWERAHAMRDAIYKHKIARVLLDSEHKELTLFWIDPETGLQCKARLDLFNEGHFSIGDVKTTVDAGYSAFTRSVVEYYYHVQDAFYTDGARICGMDAQRFFFICIEKDPPYAVAIYRLNVDEFQRVGREIYRRDLLKYKECIESGNWPGYAEEIRDLEMPGYGRYVRIS